MRVRRENRRKSFSLVELLVVISIIAILTSILLPALNTARATARTAVCIGNQKQIGLALTMYAEANDGCIVPMHYGWDLNKPLWPELLAASGLGKSDEWSDYMPFADDERRKRLFQTPLRQCPEIGSAGAIAKSRLGSNLAIGVLSDYGMRFYHLKRDASIDKLYKSHRMRGLATTMFCADAAHATNQSTAWYMTCCPSCGHLGNVDTYDPRHRGGSVILFLDGHAAWTPESDIVQNKDNLWGHE